MQDYIDENDEDLALLNLPQNYQIDRYQKPRSNQDQHKNTYGEKLIELAISSRLKFLNGRTLGDLMGKYTYIGYHGISTVDCLCTRIRKSAHAKLYPFFQSGGPYTLKRSQTNKCNIKIQCKYK